MIVSRIEGGLGNQMFQYAFGLYVARKNKTSLNLDLSSYAEGPQHGYLLDRFRIESGTANTETQSKFPRRYRPPHADQHWLPDWLRPNILRRVKEKPFGFQPHYLATQDRSYLVGYWQSERFFPGLRPELLDQFSPQGTLSNASQQVIDRMQSCPSIAIHIRRGDYLSNDKAATIYEQLGQAYYQKCGLQWAEKKQNAQAFVFSNDMNWCRENLDLPFTTHFVDHTTKADSHEDLLMMSQAACCVIANSTFSWWAAYLNHRADKVIFAPRQWFRPNTLDGSSIACSDWHSIDASPPYQLQRVA